MTRYENIIKKIKDFNDERDWDKFHTPKNLAVSISLEASELLEHFQWETDESFSEKIKRAEKLEELKDEVGDIANYLIVMCDKLGIDLFDAVEDKLEISFIERLSSVSDGIKNRDANGQTTIVCWHIQGWQRG